MITNFQGFTPRPNMTGYTGLPNEFFDLIPHLTEAELKILLVTFRKTYGWVDRIENGEVIYKLEDDISYTQYEKLTGLSSTTIARAIKSLIEKGLLVRVVKGDHTGKSSRYRIRTKGEPPDGSEDDELDNFEETDSEEQKEDKEDDVIIVKPSRKKTTIAIENVEEENFFSEGSSGGKKKKGNPYQKFMSLWLDCCRRKGFTVAQSFTGKELAHIKKLYQEYKEEDILKAIEYFVLYYHELAKTFGWDSLVPSLNIFFGFRKTLIPMALAGKTTITMKRSQLGGAREFNQEKWKEGFDFWKT